MQTTATDLQWFQKAHNELIEKIRKEQNDVSPEAKLLLNEAINLYKGVQGLVTKAFEMAG